MREEDFVLFGRQPWGSGTGKGRKLLEKAVIRVIVLNMSHVAFSLSSTAGMIASPTPM